VAALALSFASAGSALHASGLAAQAFLNTNTSGAAALMTWLLIDRIRGIKVIIINNIIIIILNIFRPPNKFHHWGRTDVPSSPVQPSVSGACVGAIVGMVVITPACGYVNTGGAMICGIVGGIVSNISCALLHRQDKVHDQLEVFPAHGEFHDRDIIATADS
jgi:ammonium transporter, Amt family